MFGIVWCTHLSNFPVKLFVRNQRLIHDSLHELLTINLICGACWVFMLNTFFMCLLDQIYFVRCTLYIRHCAHSTMLIVWSLFYLFHLTFYDMLFGMKRVFVFSLWILKDSRNVLVMVDWEYEKRWIVTRHWWQYNNLWPNDCVVQQHQIK